MEEVALLMEECHLISELQRNQFEKAAPKKVKERKREKTRKENERHGRASAVDDTTKLANPDRSVASSPSPNISVPLLPGLLLHSVSAYLHSE